MLTVQNFTYSTANMLQRADWSATRRFFDGAVLVEQLLTGFFSVQRVQVFTQSSQVVDFKREKAKCNACNTSATRLMLHVALLRKLQRNATSPYRGRCSVARSVESALSNEHFLHERTGMLKSVTLNELGRRIGESHPRAKLTDAEVDLVLELLADGMSLAQVAEKMDVSKSCIAHISSGRRRGQLVDRIVSVVV